MTDLEKAFDRYVDYVLLPTEKYVNIVQIPKEDKVENESERDRRLLREATEVSFIDVTDEPNEGVQTGQISGP